jgi:hypothetical protein
MSSVCGNGENGTQTTSVRDLPRLAALIIAAAIVTGCAMTHSAPAPADRGPNPTATAIPPALLSQARPIGAGPRFQPPATGPVTGGCLPSLGARDGVHVEVFAANRVVLLPAGIGTRSPRAPVTGRITRARCYGALVTLDTTGLVLVRPGTRLTVAALFRSWGQPLSATRLASFPAAAGSRVTVFVDGRPWRGAPGAVPLTRHAEIVLEVGPYVPPHASYAFPPGT